MHAVSVSGLKNNPAEALRQARAQPVVVLNVISLMRFCWVFRTVACCRLQVCAQPWPQPCFATVNSHW